MCARGYTAVELLLGLAIASTVAGLSVPVWSEASDHLNASGAARQVVARIALARLEAVRRSSVVGIRFEPEGHDYTFRPYLDGDGDGLRAADVTAGIDVPLGEPERLGEHFRGVRFGLRAGVPDLDGATTSVQGVRIGSTAFLSLTPAGTATGGTLYVQGTRSQFAVRVLGATGRVRVFFYDPGARRWLAR